MASKLKSVMASRNHRRSPSELKEPSEGRRERIDPCRPMVPSKDPFLPFDHPHAQQQLRERTRPSENVHSAPKKSIEVYEDDNKALGLHKRTKSSVSLKSLMGNDRTRDTKAASPEKQEKKKPKKSKSSTSLSALLPRPRSSKGLKPEVIGQPKDKENQTPPNTGEIAPPPIWAQFASQQDSVSPAKVPLNDVDDLADEMALYTPQDYSPSKQRNFGEYERPTLSRGIDKRSRPKSAVLPSAHSGTSFTETLSRLRKRSEDNGRNRLPSNDKQSRITKQESRRCSVERNIAGRRTSEEQPKKVESSEEFQSGAKRGPRVMAAVAAFNDRLQELPRPPASVNGNIETPMDPVAINDAFEELLVRHLQVNGTLAECTNRTQGIYLRMYGKR